MKSPLFTLCILGISILLSPLYGMDCDGDDRIIPLKKISSKPISLKQQFINFEKELSIELNQDNLLIERKLSSAAYIKKLNKKLPSIFESEENIEKLSRVQNSYFAKAVNSLLANEGDSHYKKVTGDTLATIHKPEISQSCAILNQLPFSLKRYIMRKAYYAIKQELVCVSLDKQVDILDVHANVNAAAAIDRNLNTFQIWNLETGALACEIPHASHDSLIRFSTDGAIIITTALSSENLTETYISFWDKKTQNRLKELIYPYPIKNIFLKNNLLHIFDTTDSLYIGLVNIKTTEMPEELSYLNIGTYLINPPFTFQGKYYLHNNVILKYPFSYFLCAQAIKNTSNVASLKKIYSTSFYESDSLTYDQRKTLKEKIEAKIAELTKKNRENRQSNSTMSFFG